MGKSNRHHYIPEFFIKAFVGNDNKLSVYNKEKGVIEKLRKSPKQIFFDWNRNSFVINGHETDFLEKVYQKGESKFAETHKKLIEKFEPISITEFDILHLTLFIAELYWRIPSQDNAMYGLVKSLNENTSPIILRNKETGKVLPFSELKPLLSEPAFIESMKKIKAIQDYLNHAEHIVPKNWLIYYLPEDAPQNKILSDNPTIIKTDNENILKSELIFPLSSGKTVFHTMGKQLKSIPAKHRVSIDILSFLQGEKYVCCSDKSYLKSISEIAKIYNTKERIEHLKNEVFKVFE